VSDAVANNSFDCAQPTASTAEAGGMMNLAQFVSALLCGLLTVASACAWSEAQPTLVLQLSHVTRGRWTPEAFTRTRDVAFSAAVAMALDQATVLPVDDLSASPPYSSLDSPAIPAAMSCANSPLALCAWANTAEESAFISALDYVELDP
jgi:hypothetical protein